MSDVLYRALTGYFKTLSVLGYKKYSDVAKILFLIFIEEYFKSSSLIADYITEEDLKSAKKALNKVYGSSCLIPKPCKPF